jgi:hypothetical protein
MFGRYAYTLNNPINLNDPDGELPTVHTGMITGARTGVRILVVKVDTQVIFAKEFLALKIEAHTRKNDPTFRGGDQQAHFVANAKASAKSPLHAAFAKEIGDKREEKQLGENPTDEQQAASELDTNANEAGLAFGEQLRPLQETSGSDAVDLVSRAEGEKYVREEKINPTFVDEKDN